MKILCRFRFGQGGASLLAAVAMALAGQPSAAQTPADPLPSASDCPTVQTVQPAHLFGLWQLTLGTAEKPEGAGQVVFESHPEFPGSVRGNLTLTAGVQGQAYTAQVAGDATDQGFQLEESADGVTIDAVWSGDVVASACGREIQGWRRVTEGNSLQAPISEHPFLLKKTPGWR